MYSWLTGEYIQNTITSYLHKFATEEPIFLRLLQILGWAVNHPIISLVILLFVIAILWIIIKGIVRLIETASWSILKFPLKLIQSLIKVTNFTWKTITGNNNNSESIAVNSLKIHHQHKQQRLTEIYRRLETIQEEQQQLLQEAAELIASETTGIKIQELQLNQIIANSSDLEITG
ncbi:hypothetical protein [Anabaena lutea]|uniref:Uncharacterized protein n=1 Tax=Anabaena lutea FACHB-196 TaxID=2692881 RepID=A0ABR8FJQ9_9NOST|nr:hypothetical protein [Anabaena lutea]MBD2570349.1 hypothetical protein [Anabaena lutea FACHB-196]